ncbi:MAG: hypothetical protein M3238_02545, partial [Actinomycetota bacterium]|nr:hypothetical protein [Actinomycetota bacterium]
VLRGDDGPNLLAGAPSRSGEAAFHGEGGDDLLVPWRGWDMGGSAGPTDIYGGDGNDIMDDRFATCRRGDIPNIIQGGGGNDTLHAWCGNVDAGDGDDFIFGGYDESHETTIDGGTGTDIAAWPHVGRDGGLEADLQEGVARLTWDAGAPPAVNRLVGVEGLEGTDGGEDLLRGDDGPNVLNGASPEHQSSEDRADTIEGRGGDDDLYGGEGNDLLDGGDGIDRADGGSGHDSCVNVEMLFSCESSGPANLRPFDPLRRLPGVFQLRQNDLRQNGGA